MDIGYFLKLMTEKHASDMFLTTGAPVYIKIEGKLYPLGNTGLPPGMVKKIAYSLMDEGQVPSSSASSSSTWPSRCPTPAASASTCSSSAAKWAW
jgi:Tfp pilus assembly ATPase PilU